MRHTSPKSIRSTLPLCYIVLFLLVVTAGTTVRAQAQTSSSQLVCSPCAVNFGNVTVGGSESMAVTLSNSGASPIVIDSKTKNAPWYFAMRGVWFPYTLGPYQSVTFNVLFAPPSNQTSSGSFTFNSNASNSTLAVSMAGTGVLAGALTVTPRTLGFGRVPVGGSNTQTLTVTNPNSSSVTLTQISSSGSALAGAFTISGVSIPITLAQGQSFTFPVTFTPLNLGDYFGNLVVATSGGTSISVAENGLGVAGGVLNVTPSALNFGNVVVGSSQSQTVTLSASVAGITVTSDSLGSAEYSVSGVTLPVVLAAGQSVPVTVTFTPQATGAANSSLAFATNYSNSNPVATSLLGTGISAVQHSVALSWQASSSSVIGYNIYRGPQSGGPYSKINSSSDSSTSYADGTVQGGNSYYYEVTSLDASGMESVPSTPVSASVPSP